MNDSIESRSLPIDFVFQSYLSVNREKEEKRIVVFWLLVVICEIPRKLLADVI